MNEHARKARLFLGMALVLLLLLSETVVAHQRLPSPWSPWVWGGLGLGVVLCLGMAAWFHRRSREPQ
jgi:drug/metabolite transporter (DMT)-like permease